jgi:hypothetical protein
MKTKQINKKKSSVPSKPKKTKKTCSARWSREYSVESDGVIIPRRGGRLLRLGRKASTRTICKDARRECIAVLGFTASGFLALGSSRLIAYPAGGWLALFVVVYRIVCGPESGSRVGGLLLLRGVRARVMLALALSGWQSVQVPSLRGALWWAAEAWCVSFCRNSGTVEGREKRWTTRTRSTTTSHPF